MKNEKIKILYHSLWNAIYFYKTGWQWGFPILLLLLMAMRFLKSYLVDSEFFYLFFAGMCGALTATSVISFFSWSNFVDLKNELFETRNI